MKKLIKLLLIGLIVSSCGYAPIDNRKPIIVTRVEKYDEKDCNYYGIGNDKMVFTLSDAYFKLRDSCGKYNIGDTIKLN